MGQCQGDLLRSVLGRGRSCIWLSQCQPPLGHQRHTVRCYCCLPVLVLPVLCFLQILSYVPSFLTLLQPWVIGKVRERTHCKQKGLIRSLPWHTRKAPKFWSSEHLQFCSWASSTQNPSFWTVADWRHLRRCKLLDPRRRPPTSLRPDWNQHPKNEAFRHYPLILLSELSCYNHSHCGTRRSLMG